MEPAIIALSVSTIVACIQIWNFFEGRSEKKENQLKVFSKATDVKAELDDVRIAAIKLVASLEIHGEKLQELEMNQAVLKERMDNTIEGQEKIENKLDKILERI